MFNYVEKILNFGFLGLAFLMLYLAYSLIKKSAESSEDVKPNESELIKKFMNIAIVFMILAGPLQWVTIWIKSDVDEKDKKVTLNIALNKTSWEDSFGKIYIRKDGEFHPLSFSALNKEFKDNDEILLNIQEIADSIKKMRRQIEVLNSKVVTDDKSIRATLEEG